METKREMTKVAGDLICDQPGVYEFLDVEGACIVKAQGVIVRDCIFRGRSAPAGPITAERIAVAGGFAAFHGYGFKLVRKDR